MTAATDEKIKFFGGRSIHNNQRTAFPRIYGRFERQTIVCLSVPLSA